MLILDFFEPAGEVQKWRTLTPKNVTLDPRVEDVRNAAYGIIAPLIVSVGMLGNLLTIIILRLPQFRGVTYTYFLALAISDFLSLLFCISVIQHILTGGTHHYSMAVWYSYWEIFFTNIPMSSSVLIVLCVTIDRFFSVCRPTDFKRIHTSHYARAGIVGSVVTSVVVWLPTCFLKEPKPYDECETFIFEAPDNGTWWVACISLEMRKNPFYIAYTWLRQTIVTFVPIIVLLALNTLILKEFVRIRKMKDKMTRNEPLSLDILAAEGRRREEHHLISLLTAVMISFFITLVPSGICNAIYTEVLATRLTFEVFRAVSNDLEILNHALNFYMYILCSKPIREAIKISFSRLKCLSRKAKVSCVVVEGHGSFTKDAKKAWPQNTADTTDSTLRRKPEDSCGDKRTPREKSKTISRDTQPSDIISGRGSSSDNFSGKLSFCTDVERLAPKPRTGSTDTLYSWGSSVHDDIKTTECDTNDKSFGCKGTQHRASCGESGGSLPLTENTEVPFSSNGPRALENMNSFANPTFRFDVDGRG
ncbi:hypothetical protein OTU49_000460 [Cherax quadricarinatus]|uniref:G-protein coupled receptors family 1 profile domain-containing protein n=1 Tax=Cherax quadricarinatus TaxID=27406 RepID=A0AAW0Y0I6_CHEQU